MTRPPALRARFRPGVTCGTLDRFEVTCRDHAAATGMMERAESANPSRPDDTPTLDKHGGARRADALCK